MSCEGIAKNLFQLISDIVLGGKSLKYKDLCILNCGVDVQSLVKNRDFVIAELKKALEKIPGPKKSAISEEDRLREDAEKMRIETEAFWTRFRNCTPEEQDAYFRCEGDNLPREIIKFDPLNRIHTGSDDVKQSCFGVGKESAKAVTERKPDDMLDVETDQPPRKVQKVIGITCTHPEQLQSEI